MRITFILPHLNLGGGVKVVVIYAQKLVSLGHEVTLVSFPQKASLVSRLRNKIRGKIAAWPQITDFFPETKSLNHITLKGRQSFMGKYVPNGDVVIATWWETAELVNRLPPEKGTKVYFVQHHEVFPYLPVDRCRATYRMPLHKIVVANWLKDVMRTEHGDHNAVVVPNSVDHSQFFALNRMKRQVSTVGILYSTTPSKGLKVSQAAVQFLRRTIPETRVIYFGSERPSKDVLSDQRAVFYYLPAQDKIREIYSDCDVWLTASTSEGFNLPAMEAMACGTPVVSTRTGWPAESIAQNVNGVLTEVDDIAALASGLEWVLTRSPRQWINLSNEAHKTVKHSSWDESTKLFENALLEFKKRDPSRS
jgi:glycosyltransferase involved in cell wall biosynthesis